MAAGVAAEVVADVVAEVVAAAAEVVAEVVAAAAAEVAAVTPSQSRCRGAAAHCRPQTTRHKRPSADASYYTNE